MGETKKIKPNGDTRPARGNTIGTHIKSATERKTTPIAISGKPSRLWARCINRLAAASGFLSIPSNDELFIFFLVDQFALQTSWQQ
jgi:hypothetical protein